MKGTAAIIAVVLLSAAPLDMFFDLGTRWEFGRYGMLAPLIAHGLFADGCPVDEFTEAFVDCHEEIMLCFVVVVVSVTGLMVRLDWRAAQIMEILNGIPKDEILKAKANCY